MRRDDLHCDLKAQFSIEKGYGVEKIDDGGKDKSLQNIYFVIPKPLPKDKDGIRDLPKAPLAKALKKAFSVLNEQKSLEEMDGIDRLISSLINRQEALSSSRIEGTFATIDELFSTESDLQGGEAKTTEKSDALSILGYAKVMDIIFERIVLHKEKGVTLALFQEIHKSIVAKDPTYLYTPGQLRSPGRPGSIVQIGGLGRREESTYNPAPPAHVTWLMDNFVGWLSYAGIREEGDAGIGIPLPLRMAMAHAHFEAIHPFTDGNGRVGRIIWPIQMLLSDLVPIHISGFIEAEKSGYYDGLKAYQQKLDLIPLVDYIADALVSSKQEAEKTRKALKLLPDTWSARVKTRKGSSAEQILALLLRLPVLGAEEAAGLLGVSLQAALTALDRLKEEGVLKEISGRKRRKKWAAHEVLTILKRPYGLSPEEALELRREKG